MIDDPRSTSRDLIKSQAFAKWQTKRGLLAQFAHPGTVDMGRDVLKQGSSDEQQTFVHVATYSIHYHRLPLPDGSTPLRQHQCESCVDTLTIPHLMTCPTASTIAMREDLRQDLLTIFDDFDECKDWQIAMSRVDLKQMSIALFPPAAATAQVKLNHNVRCMIGAFTKSECQHAIKSLNIKTIKHSLTGFQMFRCVCLKHIANFYAKLSNLHPLPP